MVLKMSKSRHAVEELEAVGMVYGKTTMEKTAWTYKVIESYPVPKGPKSLLSFLSLGQYYSPFTEGYASLIAPLRRLTRKKHWAKSDMAVGSDEFKLFVRVREELAMHVKLALPDWSKDFIVKSDWSIIGMGGALLQKDDKEELRPIAFISRQTSVFQAGGRNGGARRRTVSASVDD